MNSIYSLRDKLEGEAKAVGAEQWGFGKVFKYENIKTNPTVQFMLAAHLETFPNNQWIAESGRNFNQNDVERY